MLITRDIQAELLDAATEYPVVTIRGPRQSGKTTLVRMAFPGHAYRSLEDPDTRLFALQDPRGFLADVADGAILDEIQRCPDLLSYIQGLVDEDDRVGRFILTGSHQPELSQAVSQTLAGRTALLTLLPFAWNELRHFMKTDNPFCLAHMGGYPRLHAHGLKPGRFFSGYLQTYVERDARALMQLSDLDRFQVFLRLVAGRIGQLLNYSSIANDVGVSSETIKSWISVLKASFIVFELLPYHGNIRKRLTKSSKLYFLDMGLASYLLGIDTPEQLERDTLRGNLYENLMILEYLKQELNQGIRPDLYFYRDSNGNEVDLVVRQGRELHPVEIKSGATFVPEFARGIERFAKAAGKQCRPGRIWYNGTRQLMFKQNQVLNPLLHGTFQPKPPAS